MGLSGKLLMKKFFILNKKINQETQEQKQIEETFEKCSKTV